MTEREMASFLSTPRCGLPGFTLNFTGYDPTVSPTGEYLTCVGASFDATEHYGDRAWLDRKFAELWDDIEEMMPAARPLRHHDRGGGARAPAGALRGHYALLTLAPARQADLAQV
ncbi:MAG: hypothetical protein L0I76_04610 [Pseudonocardia sp.]|nr:hypothetical protein [Pseudonocardia sp.]